MASKPHRVPESVVQQHIVTALRALGASVYVLGTKRGRGEKDHGTHQTPGIPDLLAFVPRVPGTAQGCIQLWIEVKAQGGRVRPEQVEFKGRCIGAGVAHVMGDLDAVYEWLLEQKIIRSHQVPYYRLPAESQT